MESDFELRALQQADSLALHQATKRNQSYLRRFFPVTLAQTASETLSKKYVENLCRKREARETYGFGIWQDQRLMGLIFIKNIDWRVPKCELAYFIDESCAGQGIGSAATGQIVRHCFEELGMEKIFVRISLRNRASVRVAEKNGFEQEGLLRKEFKIETGEIVDMAYFGKIKTV